MAKGGAKPRRCRTGQRLQEKTLSDKNVEHRIALILKLSKSGN